MIVLGIRSSSRYYSRHGYSSSSSLPFSYSLQTLKYFSTSSGDDENNYSSKRNPNQGDGNINRGERVKGSMENFLRQAKSKTSSDDTKPWSVLLNHTQDEISSTQDIITDRLEQKQKNKPMLDDEILASLYQDDQYDSDYTPSDAELYRQTESALNEEYKTKNINDSFTPSDVDEDDDDEELHEMVDAYLDQTPEKVKNMEEKYKDDNQMPGSDFELEVKDEKTDRALKKFYKGVEYLESRRRRKRRDESDEEEEENLDTIYDELRFDELEKEKDEGYVSDDPPGYQYEEEVMNGDCLELKPV